MSRAGPTIMPGAEPFTFEGRSPGFLLLHGFTGNPASLRPWGEWLRERGHAVTCPRLPGHGTTWQDLGTVRWEDWVGETERALAELSGRASPVVVCGLSMGGAMALLLGARHPDRIRGVVAVNPYVRDRRLAAAPLVRPFRKTVRGVGNDIKKPGQDELPYERVPLKGSMQLGKFLAVVQKSLPNMNLPLLLFHAPDDHVVPRGTHDYVLSRVGSDDTQLVLLPDCYHVATLDNEAETIFERSYTFAERVTAPRG